MRCLPALVLAAAPVSAAAAPSWPDEFRPRPAKVIEADAPAGVAAAHETAHFRLHADDAIDRDSLQRFATILEAVPQLLERLPLPLWQPPGGRKPLIQLCKDEDTFRERGGPPGSAGYYDGRKARVLIRADLFLAPPRASRLRAAPNEDLLVHELTHVGMHGVLGPAKPWLAEGIAEYLAAAHQAHGAFDFSDPHRNIRDHIRKYLPPEPDGRTILPSLAPLLATDGQGWIDTNTFTDGAARYRPYAAALLLTHYHLSSADRREALARHLDALASHRNPRKRPPVLTSPSPAEIEELLTRYWSSRGIRLSFR